METVGSIMTCEVITVDMDTTLLKIREVFKKYKFHHLPIMEDDELVGVISDRDLLRELSPFVNSGAEMSRDTKTLSKKAHQVMSRKPITVTKEDSIEGASELLLKHNISCLPVISPDGKLEGVITLRDILRFYIQVCQSDDSKKTKE